MFAMPTRYGPQANARNGRTATILDRDAEGASMRLLSTFADSDTVSDLLRSLRVRSNVFCLATMRAPWGFGVPAQDVASFHIVLDGGGVLEVDGEPPLELARGDLVVLPHGDAHVVRDGPGSAVTPIETLEPETETSWEVRAGADGPPTELICGTFELVNAQLLLSALPSVLRIPGRAGRPVEWLEASVRLLRGEMPVCEPGAEEIVTRVTDVLVAQAIRVHLLDNGRDVAVLGDPQIGAAVRLIHADPARPWTVTELAARVALSRSAFSSRFRALTGESPMRYVARFRLAHASELLRASDTPLAGVARSSGYGSEASFSRAFQRWFGTTPGSYRRRARAS
jgi:AraC-like DNA-binding protein/mannose-6-phosphate isomerase-like protein (cupin superfamily)